MTELTSSLGISLLTGRKPGGPLPAYLCEAEAQNALRFHQSVPGYRETPLRRLRHLAEKLGVREIFVKDESLRFGLNAFKSLGSLYAMSRLACREFGWDGKTVFYADLQTPQAHKKLGEMAFATATDGNHGRGVAWSASRLGCRSFVYMPKGTVESRFRAIAAIPGATVTVTDLTYDETVALAARKAKENGWVLMQDTAWEGYEAIPADITAGYQTLPLEILSQMHAYGEKLPTHIFLQAGVGSMAAGVLGYFAACFGENAPAATILEPETVACIYASAKAADGMPHSIAGETQTIMAGLNCGTPSKIAWPVLRDHADFYAKCPDFVSARGMRLAAAPQGEDPHFLSGESAGIGLGFASLVLSRKECAAQREALGFTKDSVLLMISTEGNTDPEGYEKTVYDGAYPVP